MSGGAGWSSDPAWSAIWERESAAYADHAGAERVQRAAQPIPSDTEGSTDIRPRRIRPSVARNSVLLPGYAGGRGTRRWPYDAPSAEVRWLAGSRLPQWAGAAMHVEQFL